MHGSDVWTYRDTALGSATSGTDVVGYDVEALDGSIGKVDEATFDAGSAYIVVDTGPWIFGKKVMIPAGVIRDADHNEEKVFVNRTKEQIKNAPEFDDTLTGDESYRTRLGSLLRLGRLWIPRLEDDTANRGRARSTEEDALSRSHGRRVFRNSNVGPRELRGLWAALLERQREGGAAVTNAISRDRACGTRADPRPGLGGEVTLPLSPI